MKGIDTASAMPIAEDLIGERVDSIDPFVPSVGGDDSYSWTLSVGGEKMILKIKRDPQSPIGIYFHPLLSG